MVEGVIEIDLEADPDDRVSLADFAQWWWANQSHEMAQQGERASRQFLDNKQASIRMLRRNHEGFPSPVAATSGTQLYSLGDVAAWTVKAHDPSSTLAEAIRTRSADVGVQWHVDRAVDACAAEIGPGSTRRLALLIVVALDRAGVGPGLSRLPAKVRALVEQGSGLPDLLRTIKARRATPPPGLPEAVSVLLEDLPIPEPKTARLARAMAAWLLTGREAAVLADDVLDRADRQDSAAALRRTGDSLTMLMLAAGQPRPGERIVDLAAGEAGLLIGAAGQAGGPVGLTGIEVHPGTWAVGCCRLYLHRLEADFRRGDSLRGPESLPTGDLVLVDPPVDKRRDYVRWLAAAVNACAEGGRAIVALPALTTEPGRKEWKEWGFRHCAFLVKCPARLRADRGVTLAVWGLERNPGEDMLLVDASPLGMRTASLSEIDENDAARLWALIEDWRQTGRVDSVSKLPAAVFPRAAYRGLPAELGRRVQPGRDIRRAMSDALELAELLEVHLEGDLRPYTAEQHRRAIEGLTARLKAQINTVDMETAGR
jgi:hypothetical protein